MRSLFRNRVQAGQLLAEKLADFEGQSGLTVLALPRGGVPVAAEVARRLHAGLDVMVVRKLGLPGQPELAMGAIASGGIRLLNEEIITRAGIPSDIVEAVAEHEERELERRERAYRQGRPVPVLDGQTVILVDDGIATGSTMSAAIQALRQGSPYRLIVATPTIARETLQRLRLLADEVVYVIAPENFGGVGQWYEAFTQVTDEEVRKILGQFHNYSAVR